MNVNMKSLIFIIFLILLLGINSASAIDDNITSTMDCIEPSNDCLESEDDEIIVSDWDELQYYCSLTDKDYTLKLKEDTNFYPSDFKDVNKQIKINNNVKIIGSEGSYFGDSQPASANYIDEGNYINYMPIVVPDGNGMGITLENITFKWIYTIYNPDAVFLQMGGNGYNVIKNCFLTASNPLQVPLQSSILKRETLFWKTVLLLIVLLILVVLVFTIRLLLELRAW